MSYISLQFKDGQVWQIRSEQILEIGIDGPSLICKINRFANLETVIVETKKLMDAVNREARLKANLQQGGFSPRSRFAADDLPAIRAAIEESDKLIVLGKWGGGAAPAPAKCPPNLPPGFAAPMPPPAPQPGL